MKNRFFSKIVLLSVFVIILAVVVKYASTKSLPTSTVEKSQTGSSGATGFFTFSSPSPVPFVELTIPYLRSREYKSSLGSLQKVSEASTYTSYLTSYDSDGFKVNALLTAPKGTKPASGFPAVVFVHGYIPPTQYETLTRYTDHVDYLSRNGFVVFKIDLRGHGKSEGQPSGGYYSADYVVDTLNARAALEASGSEIGINSAAIGLWGHSMAGNVVLRAFAARPEIPAVVAWAGAGFTYADLREFGIDDNSYRPPPNDSQRQQERQKLRDTHGDFDPSSSFWKQVTPANYLSDLKGAMQLNHAVDDNVVSIDYSRNLNTLLTNARVSHELKEYPSGGHNIIGGSFTQAMQNTAEFYKQYLK